MNDYIRTYTGLTVRPLKPMHPEDIDILDIAHALSNNCRFCGHVRIFYSVAEHCVRGAAEVSLKNRLAFLLHDASEAYIADLAKPLKQQPDFTRYREIEAVLSECIAIRFGIEWPEPVEVKLVDQRMLATELRDLMPTDEPLPYKPFDFPVLPVLPSIAKAAFLDLFLALTGAPDDPTDHFDLYAPSSLWAARQIFGDPHTKT